MFAGADLQLPRSGGPVSRWARASYGATWAWDLPDLGGFCDMHVVQGAPLNPKP